MTHQFRSLLAAAAMLLGSFAFAQPYHVLVSGNILPCDSESIGDLVSRQWSIDQGWPQFGYVEVTDPCSYQFLVDTWDAAGYISARFICSSGDHTIDSVYYSLGLSDTVAVQLDLYCGGNIQPCQAAFNVQQAMSGGNPVPWQITTLNLSGASAPMTYLWTLPDGSNSTAVDPTFTFLQPGGYSICLTITAAAATAPISSFGTSGMEPAPRNLTPRTTTQALDLGSSA